MINLTRPKLHEQISGVELSVDKERKNSFRAKIFLFDF